MLEFLKKRIFGRSTKKEAKATVEVCPGTKVVSVNQENMDETEKESLRSLASELSNLTFFEGGHIKHGYSLHSVSNPAQCPRCKASTQQQYANFIYATNVAPRVMLAPAGYFCTKCPTVIVDEDLIQAGIRGKFKYQGVLGLDYEGSKEPDLLQTWNGSKPVYIFDENEVAMGLATLPPSAQQHSISKPRKMESRKRMAKESRKRNRRKK
jgi:hypothetical protein